MHSFDSNHIGNFTSHRLLDPVAYPLIASKRGGSSYYFLWFHWQNGISNSPTIETASFPGLFLYRKKIIPSWCHRITKKTERQTLGTRLDKKMRFLHWLCQTECKLERHSWVKIRPKFFIWLTWFSSAKYHWK